MYGLLLSEEKEKTLILICLCKVCGFLTHQVPEISSRISEEDSYGCWKIIENNEIRINLDHIHKTAYLLTHRADTFIKLLFSHFLSSHAHKKTCTMFIVSRPHCMCSTFTKPAEAYIKARRNSACRLVFLCYDCPEYNVITKTAWVGF